MQFKLLGPLEVADDKGRALPLNGNKQRATLGFLLLHGNSVIATSRILKALWPADMPPTGRKMLQNAVSGLRGMLSAQGRGPDSALLLTHAPGYLLRVEPDRVDLSRFHSLATSGRTDLAAGSWEQAARTLREALGLWRGPALTDLVESGVTWPELTTVQNAQLAAFEDYVEAELACGRHNEMVSALETWVEAEPLRERLCGQLMRALYYCGRQVDALGLYRRTRTRLIEELGLDPSRDLQELERSILNQELVLEPRPILFRSILPADASPPERIAEIGPQTTAPQPETGSRQAPISCQRRGDDKTGGYAVSELKWVTIVLVMTRFDRDVGDADPEDVDAVLQDVAVTVHEEITHLGGTVGGTIGSVWQAVFGASQNREDDAGRAVRAAMAVRDRLCSDVLPSRRVVPLAVMAAVATGDALVTHQKDDRDEAPSVTGEVLDKCVGLLAHVSANEVLVCETTRRTSDLSITYDVTRGPVERSRAVAFHPELPDLELTVPFVNRDRELTMLLGLFDQVCRQSRTHLITILGEPGIGKSRLIAEFERAITGTSGKARCLVCHTLHFGRNNALTPLQESVKFYAQINGTDPVEVAEKKLDNAVCSLAGAGAKSSWVLSHLRALVGLTDSDVADDVEGAERQQIRRESSTAWRQFLEIASSEGPLVVVIEDLHSGDDALLDFVDHLTEQAGSCPLLVIVTARPDLLDRRPAWGGGKVRATTTTLDPLSDDDATRLLALLCARSGTASRHLGVSSTGATDLLRTVASRVGGNPLFIIEYARMFREDGHAGFRDPHEADGLHNTSHVDLPLHIPHLVHRVLASRLDSLPAGVKAVLLDAAVLGDAVCEAGLAAVGGRAASEVSPFLQYLERWEFLTRTNREPSSAAASYVFRSVLVRDVAYRMIPRTTRADKHQRATAWLERLPRQNAKLLAYHQRQATVSPLASEGNHACECAAHASGPVTLADRLPPDPRGGHLLLSCSRFRPVLPQRIF